jgi:hypothetical protein
MTRTLKRKAAAFGGLVALLAATGLFTSSTPAASSAGCTVAQVERCCELCCAGNDFRCFNACLDYCLNPSEE